MRRRGYRRQSRWLECTRAILRIALIALLLGILLPRGARAQAHDISVPNMPVVNPMYPQTSTYLADSTYDRWWHETAACLDVPLPPFYLLVKFVQINYPYFDLPADEPAPPGEGILGHSFVTEWQMFVAIGYRWTREVITHEMAHFLLFWARKARGGHPARYFNGRCGFYAKYQGLPPSNITGEPVHADEDVAASDLILAVGCGPNEERGDEYKRRDRQLDDEPPASPHHVTPWSASLWRGRAWIDSGFPLRGRKHAV